MRRNVRGVDRGVRAVLAVVLLSIAYLVELPKAWEAAVFLLGAIAAFTALTAYCPLKELFGADDDRRGLET
jgi:hypothetical protein